MLHRIITHPAFIVGGAVLLAAVFIILGPEVPASVAHIGALA